MQPNKYTREETIRLTAVLRTVCSVHGKNHPELFEIQTTFSGLAQELATSSNVFGMFGVPDGI